MTANDQIEMLVGDGRGGFTPGNFFRVGKRPYQRLRSAGLNGDGKPDIVTTNLDGDSVTVLLGMGVGISAKLQDLRSKRRPLHGR
jgi:hypothetical protein